MIKIKNPIKVLDTIATITGIACIFYGIYQIYPPVSWVVLGIVLSFPGIPKKAVK